MKAPRKLGARRCAICGKPLGVTWYLGVPAHTKCWRAWTRSVSEAEFERQRKLWAAAARNPDGGAR